VTSDRRVGLNLLMLRIWERGWEKDKDKSGKIGEPEFTQSV